MMDIATWLGQQLDEDEAMARAAAAFYDDDDQDGVSWNGRAGRDLDGYTRFWIAPHLGVVNDVASGLHINRHDPARVLREVAAKRRVLARHHAGSDGSCDGCGYDQERGPWIERHEDCPELRDMASVYTDRPGYKEEWKPTEPAPTSGPAKYWATLRRHEQEARDPAAKDRYADMWKAQEEGEKP